MKLKITDNDCKLTKKQLTNKYNYYCKKYSVDKKQIHTVRVIETSFNAVLLELVGYKDLYRTIFLYND